MKSFRKIFILSFTLLLTFILASCTKVNKEYELIADEINPVYGEITFISMDENSIKPLTERTITMTDIALFLEQKAEHYPLSDEFIERYQQKSGGYIDNAKKAGLEVNKLKHEPNQKWHFFESWLYPSIEDQTLTWDESAESRVYKKLLCPELLLWIYEACEVDPSKVQAAKEVAEAGKIAGTHTSTVAKNMRACVSWDDMKPAILAYLEGNVESYPVYVNQDNGFTVNKLQSEYREGSEVSFTISLTDTTKEIDTVTVNGTAISATSGTTYKFTMPSSEVTINITLKDKEIIPTPDLPTPDNPTPDLPVTEGSIAIYNIVYDLGSRKTAKQLSTADEVFNAFEFSGKGSDIILSISQFEYIYGGGYGGSDPNKWVANDMLKFGTTSVNGNLTFNLTTEVNCIKITGYVSNTSCSIRVGDSNSTDWTSDTNDNKTSKVTCSNMTVTTKDTVEGNQTSTITIYFESTKDLKISVTNKTPLYITSIEFIVDNQNNN